MRFLGYKHTAYILLPTSYFLPLIIAMSPHCHQYHAKTR